MVGVVGLELFLFIFSAGACCALYFFDTFPIYFYRRENVEEIFAHIISLCFFWWTSLPCSIHPVDLDPELCVFLHLAKWGG